MTHTTTPTTCIFHTIGCCPSKDLSNSIFYTDPNRCEKNQKDTEYNVQWFIRLVQQNNFSGKIFVMGIAEEQRTFRIINSLQAEPLAKWTPITGGKVEKLREVNRISNDSFVVLYTAKEFQKRYQILLALIRFLDFIKLKGFPKHNIKIVPYHRDIIGGEVWNIKKILSASVKDIFDVLRPF